MKKVLFASIAFTGLMAFAAPAYACYGNACPTSTTPTVSTPAPSSSSIRGGMHVGGFGQGKSSAWNNDDGGNVIARGVGREGLSQLVAEGEINGDSCDSVDCRKNSVTARVAGRVVESAFSYNETTGRFAEGGSTAEVNLKGGFDGHVGRILTYEHGE